MNTQWTKVKPNWLYNKNASYAAKVDGAGKTVDYIHVKGNKVMEAIDFHERICACNDCVEDGNHDKH